MKTRTIIVIILLSVFISSHETVFGDEATEPVAAVDPIQKGTTVLGLKVGYGVAHEIAYSSPNHQFIELGGRIGRVLTHPRGPGFLKGNLEFTFEALPIFLHYDDEMDYGASFTLLLRQYFAPGSRWRPFFTFGAGALVSTQQVPDGTSRLNFTPQAGFGLAMAHSHRTVVTVEYRYHHISNADTAEPNPGINSSSFHFGVSLFR
jgi:hypothetical protein